MKLQEENVLYEEVVQNTLYENFCIKESNWQHLQA